MTPVMTALVACACEYPRPVELDFSPGGAMVSDEKPDLLERTVFCKSLFLVIFQGRGQ